MTSVDEVSNSTQYRYNAAGLPTIIQGSTGIQTTALYNALGHKIQMSDPNQGTMTFKYNALGELRQQTDANAVTTTFNYDKLGRTTTRTADNGEAASHWAFDGNGIYGTLTREYLGSSVATSDFIKDYVYSTRGVLAQVTIDNMTPFVQTYGVDANFGRPTLMTQPDGTAVYYHYKNNGFLQGESQSAVLATNTLRTINTMDHLTTAVTYNNGLTSTTTKKAGGVISDICTAIASASCGTTSEAQHIVYDQYDSFGHLGRRDNRTQAVLETFNYDLQDRLKSVEKVSFANAAEYTYYDYDASGNLTNKSDFSVNSTNGYHYGTSDPAARASSTSKAGPNAATYVSLKDDALGQNQSGRAMYYHYDMNGNIISNTVKKAGAPDAVTRTLTYNSNNKPTIINATTTFSYGSDGMRYKQVVGDKTTYYIGGGYEVEVNGSTTTTRAYIGDYALKVGGTSPDAGLKYLHRDRLGSVDTITDATMTATTANIDTVVKDRRSYNVFGKARNDDGGIETDGLFSTSITNRGFTNHEHLSDSGLIHMNGRAYDPDLGRLMSVDPFISMPENGQSLNPYSYVINNPLKYTDPSGYIFGSSWDECENDGNCTNVIGKSVVNKTTTTTMTTLYSDGSTTSSSFTTQVALENNDIPSIGSITGKGEIDWANDQSITAEVIYLPGLPPIPILLKVT